MRCAASKMTTVATRRMGSRAEESDPLEEDDRSRRSEDGEDDSGMVCDDVSGHMVPSSSSSRSSIFSNDGRLQEEQSKSDELLSRLRNSRKIRKTSGRGSDQSLNGRSGDEDVFGNYSNDGHRSNRKTKTWGGGPVNVIVQHNQDGTVTTKAVTPTECTQRDFTSYVGHRAPKSLSMNDIGSVGQRESSGMDAEEDVDDVDGVFHVRRMIRDNSMELFSLPEYRAEPDDSDPHRSRESSEAADVEISGSARNKSFKPLIVFPGGENIPERDYDTLKDKPAEDENPFNGQTKDCSPRTTNLNVEQRDGQIVMSSTEYVGTPQTVTQYVAYHHICDKDRFHETGMQAERMGPIGTESPGNLIQKDDKSDINNQQIAGLQGKSKVKI